MKKYIHLIKYLKNKYYLASIFFFIWILFFDNNDLFSFLSNKMKVQELIEEKSVLEQSIEDKKAQYQKLLESQESLEKFAREHYGMKTDNEVVFRIDEDKLK